MEESEKRRERLKAMRMEAARGGVNIDSDISGFPSRGLSNPLIDSETASAAPLQYNSRRFDYYTDPMSAFSGSKRTTNISPQVSQGLYNTPPRPVHQNMTPFPAYQNPTVNPPGQRMFQVPGAHFYQSPYGVPTEVGSHLGGPQGNPASSWGGSGGAFGHNTHPNFSRGGKFGGPGPGQGNSPYVNHGRGRGQRYDSSSHYDSGHGGMSRGARPSGRGAGSHGSVSAEVRPDLYYRKEMVEDPWKLLNPVIWKGVRDQDKQSWLPKSIAVKKAKVSSEASNISIPQPSLAEYLAASFNDSINEEQGT